MQENEIEIRNISRIPKCKGCEHNVPSNAFCIEIGCFLMEIEEVTDCEE